ncbi:hypothetical protein ACOBR2_18410 [Telmatobacter bradus]|uniref:hypothetical protein n=1 Tax=Telmatobacter bradus TaxID=474953 RepID=UPI003B43A18D
MSFFFRLFSSALVLSVAVLAQAQAGAPAGQSSSQIDDQQAATINSIGNAKGEQPGFPVAREHFWDRIGVELSGGYLPVLGKGNGYFNSGYEVAGGAVDHLGPHWNLLAEAQFFWLNGTTYSSSGLPTSYSNTNFSASLGAAYIAFPKAYLSPYLLAEVGDAYLGPVSSVTMGISGQSFNALHAPLYTGGVGVRHRLYPDLPLELYAEGRFSRFNTGTSNLGQITLMPIRAGLRW